MRLNFKDTSGIALLELAILLVIIVPLGFATFALIDLFSTESRLEFLLDRELQEIRLRTMRFERGGQAFWGVVDKDLIQRKLKEQDRSNKILSRVGLSNETIKKSKIRVDYVFKNILPSTGEILTEDNIVQWAVASEGPKVIENVDVDKIISTSIEQKVKTPRYKMAIPTAIFGVLYQAEYGAINLLGGPMSDDGNDKDKMVTNDDVRADYVPQSGELIITAVVPMRAEPIGALLSFIDSDAQPIVISVSRSSTAKLDF